MKEKPSTKVEGNANPPAISEASNTRTNDEVWATKFVPQVAVGPPRRDVLNQPLLNTSGAGGGIGHHSGGSHVGPHFSGATPHDSYPLGVSRGYDTLNMDTMNGDLGTGQDYNTISGAYVRQDRERSIRSQASSARSSVRGSTISFHHINYVVYSKKMPWSKPVRKDVLSDVSGVIRPGMNAIMGPTGSGKSSLLDVLAGRKNPKFLDGEVLVDGSTQPANFKCISGYVVQDDIVMGTLTVRENLRFSAALRLPAKYSDEERKLKVNSVIEELGLLNVADSKIGNELIRGVSGGERKRCNIGMELITDPSILFLDEPTTGLDAFTAGSVIKTLRNLALRGRTIIFSIHQPKYSIYKLFDTLTMVCRGQLVYHGPADDHPLKFFQAAGYVCEAHNNPPDFFMDILHGDVKKFNPDDEDEVRRRREVFDNEDFESGINSPNSVDHNGEESSSNQESIRLVSDRLIKNWKKSEMAIRVTQDSERILNEARQSTNPNNPNVSTRKGEQITYPTSFPKQCWWVCWRTGINLFRNPHSSVVQLAVYLFFAISVGIVYHPLNSSTESGIQNRMGLFFFSCIQMVFVNLSAIEIFIKERVIFIHENSSGYYRVSVYFIAKILCDMMPIKVMPVALFMPMTYFIAKLRADAGAFFFFELNLILTTIAACGVAFFISASVSVFGVANILISIIYVFMMVFGGFLINVGTMGWWLRWCQYLSIFRYSINGLAVNELKDMVFCPTLNYTASNSTLQPSCINGSSYLTENDILYKTDWNLWLNELGLSIISIIFLALCYMQLRIINKYK